MILIVGLGNPGMEYRGTKHNAGFDVLDKIADENGLDITKKTCKSLVFCGKLFDKQVVLAKPQTYMNLSGEAVVELINFYKPEKVLVVFDDVDLPFGTIRYRKNGSAGTHNGMRNIVALTGKTDIPRLRIGIKPDETIYNLADYVLGKIEKQYRDDYEKSLDLAYEKVREFLKNDGEII